MTAVWPAELPQFVLERGFSESLPDTNIESQVDAGLPKVRPRFTKNLRPMQWVIECTMEQKAIFEGFYFDTLRRGVLPFRWVNPMTQAPAQYRFRRPPPSFAPFGSYNVAITMTVWQVKQLAAFRFDSTEISFDSTLHSFDEANRY